VSGHPGSTERLDTYAQLEFDREYVTPSIVRILKQRIATLREYAARGPEQARQITDDALGLENSLKVFEGQHKGLQDPHLMAKKRQDEEDFKAKVMANPEWKKEYGESWETLAKVIETEKPRVKQQFYRSFDSQLVSLAVNIVTYVAEVKKPDG